MQASFRPDLTPALIAIRDAEARTPAAITAMREQVAARLATVTAAAIIAETPVGDGPIHDPEHTLAGSTGVDISDVPGGVLLAFSQTAESRPNNDGSGGGFHYMQAVWHGRKAISAPSTGPWSTGKMALRTPWGPRKSVGASKPNDYPERAMATASGPIALALHEGAQFGAGMIARTIGGAA